MTNIVNNLFSLFDWLRKKVSKISLVKKVEFAS